MPDASERTIRCVGALLRDDRGRLLLVRRATEPGRGRWSLPGGRVERDETDSVALRREVFEETGLTVVVGRLVGSVLRAAPGGVYDIHDYECSLAAEPGVLRPGDDAADARWVSAREYPTLPVVARLTETLAGWGMLPGQPAEPA